MRSVCVVLGLAVAQLIACTAEDSQLMLSSYSYDFAEDMQGWTGDFALYYLGDSIESELMLDHTFLPATTGLQKKAVYMTGINKGQGLFMFIKKKLSGFSVNEEYTVVFDIEYASDAEPGVGAAGNYVWLKAGATSQEPKKVLEGRQYIMNIDKGEAGESGADMIIMGNIEKTSQSPGFSLMQQNSTYTNQVYKVRANNRGDIWLIVGTDSKFVGKTALYYSKVAVVLTKSS